MKGTLPFVKNLHLPTNFKKRVQQNHHHHFSHFILITFLLGYSETLSILYNHLICQGRHTRAIKSHTNSSSTFSPRVWRISTKPRPNLLRWDATPGALRDDGLRKERPPVIPPFNWCFKHIFRVPNTLFLRCWDAYGME